MSEPNKPRRRRWWLPIVIAAGVLTALAAWWSTQLSPMARLRASGAPVTFEDLVPPDTPIEGNAAATLEAVFPRLDSLPSEVYERASESTERTLVEPELIEARDLLATAETIYNAIDKAAEEPRYVAPVLRKMDDRLRRVQSLRNLSRLSTLRTRVAIASQEPEAATRSAASAMHVAKHVEVEPMLVGRMVACAIQQAAVRDALAVVDSFAVDDGVVTDFGEAFAAFEDRSSYVGALESERVYALAQFDTMALPVRLWERPALLRLIESAIERAPAIGTGEQPRLSAGGVLAGTSLAGFEAAFAAENRLVAVARCARIRLALRNASADAMTTADSLGLPASTLFDPFGGEPLLVVHRDATPEREAGWWAYSVGPDLQDDGGSFEDGADYGFAPPRIPWDAAGQ